MATYSRVKGAEPKGVCRRENVYVSGGVVYPGDFVSSDSTGRVVAASASSALLGVALSYASAAAVNILVADHPDQEFVIAANSTSISVQTALMLNYNIYATTGSTAFKISRMALDATTGLASVATLPLRALAIDQTDYNSFGSAVEVVVVINNHQLKGGTGTIGT